MTCDSSCALEHKTHRRRAKCKSHLSTAMWLSVREAFCLAGPRHKNANRQVDANRNRNSTYVGVAVRRGLLNEETWNHDLHWSGMHDHRAVRQKVDPLDLPAIFATTTTRRIPGMSVRSLGRRQQQEGNCKHRQTRAIAHDLTPPGPSPQAAEPSHSVK